MSGIKTWKSYVYLPGWITKNIKLNQASINMVHNSTHFLISNLEMTRIRNYTVLVSVATNKLTEFKYCCHPWKEKSGYNRFQAEFYIFSENYSVMDLLSSCFIFIFMVPSLLSFPPFTLCGSFNDQFDF